MVKWEYLEVDITWNELGFYRAQYSLSMAVNGFDRLDEVLNYFGDEGWELEININDKYLFKRPKQNHESDDRGGGGSGG